MGSPPGSATRSSCVLVRVVALDLGSRRIGVAVSDPTGVLASPYEVLERSSDVFDDIGRIVEEVGAELVVVGLPLSLDGRRGTAADAATAEADRLREALDVPVELYDERFTTVTAQQSMADRKVKARARHQVVDKLAAAVLLQSWLDGHR